MKRRETRGRVGKRFGRAARDRGSWWREASTRIKKPSRRPFRVTPAEKPIEFQRQ